MQHIVIKKRHMSTRTNKLGEIAECNSSVFRSRFQAKRIIFGLSSTREVMPLKRLSMNCCKQTRTIGKKLLLYLNAYLYILCA